MATASALGRPTPHDTVTRPNMVSVGTIVWLSSELMFFAALFAMYFTIRSVSDVWPAKGVHLDIPFDGSITIILVLSSITCQAGVFAAERGQLRRASNIFHVGQWGAREWIVLTVIMGAIFDGGQCYEYADFVSEYHSSGGLEGMMISSSAYGSIFFIATGFHALHVLGGLGAFVLLLARLSSGRFTPEKLTSTIVVSYYWHFVDIVWIGLFSVIFLVQ